MIKKSINGIIIWITGNVKTHQEDGRFWTSQEDEGSLRAKRMDTSSLSQDSSPKIQGQTSTGAPPEA